MSERTVGIISIDRDVEDTARLIMMDEKDNTFFGPILFKHRMLNEGYRLTAMAVDFFWAKYMGFDGYKPTHYINTGAIIREPFNGVAKSNLSTPHPAIGVVD